MQSEEDTKRFETLSEFERKFAKIWAFEAKLDLYTSGFFIQPDGQIVTEKEMEFEPSEVSEYTMFGYDTATYRLVDCGDYVEYYPWCWNSQGSTPVSRMNTDEFLAKAEIMRDALEGTLEHPLRASRFDKYTDVWYEHFEGHETGATANW